MKISRSLEGGGAGAISVEKEQVFVVQLLGGASIPCEAIIFLNLIVSAFVSSTSPFLADIDNACQIVIKGHASIKGAKDKKKIILMCFD